MGLLDDAIREHLDLKRRRGADPAEVERAEREALGPVRRGPEGSEPPDPGLDEPVAYDHAEDVEWAEPFADTGEAEPFPERLEPEPFDAGEPFLDEAPPIPEPRAGRRASREFDEPPPEPFDHGAEAPPSSESFDHTGGAPSSSPSEPVDHTVPVSERFDHAFDTPPGSEPFDDAPGAPPAPHPAAPPATPARGEHLGEETIEYEVEAALEKEDRDKRDDDVLEETPDFLQDTPDHDRLWFEQRPPRDFDFDG